MRTIKKIFNTTVSVKEGASRNVLRGIIQYDTLNEVNIRLSDGSKAFDYTGYTNIIFKVLKADGTSYIDSEGENVIATSPVDGIITVNLAGQSTTVAGLCQSVIEVYSGEDKMTTARLNYEVFEALDTAEATESESQYPVFQTLMADLSALEASIEAAEAARVEAEAARASAATGYVAKARSSAAEAAEWAMQAKNIAGGNIAPAGYGLGEEYLSVVDRSQLDSVKRAGWYMFFDVDNRVEGHGSGFVECRGMNAEITGACVQEFYASAHGIPLLKRYFDGTEWTPWEWENPPMKEGVEYRTTEKYLHRPVYAKIVNFGALPNAGQKTAQHGVSDMKCCISLGGNAGQYNLIGFGGVSKAFCGSAQISITTTEDLSAYTAMVLIKYTKTTDT